MAIVRAIGEDLIRDFNVRAKRPVGTYSSPAVGDLLVLDATGTEFVDRAAASEVPYALLHSVNSGNGILSVVELMAGVTAMFEIASGKVLGNQIQAQGGARGTVLPLRDRVKGVASAGVGFITALDSNTPSGLTDTALVRFP